MSDSNASAAAALLALAGGDEAVDDDDNSTTRTCRNAASQEEHPRSEVNSREQQRRDVSARVGAVDTIGGLVSAEQSRSMCAAAANLRAAEKAVSELPNPDAKSRGKKRKQLHVSPAALEEEKRRKAVRVEAMRTQWRRRKRLIKEVNDVLVQRGYQPLLEAQALAAGKAHAANVARENLVQMTTIQANILQASKATSAWRSVVDKAEGQSAERRIHHLTLAINKLGGHNTSRAKELRRCVASVEPNKAIFVEHPSTSGPSSDPVCAGFIMNLTSAATEVVPPAVRHCFVTGNFPRNTEDAIDRLLLPLLRVAQEHGEEDKVRKGIRTNFGYAEMPTAGHRHHDGNKPVYPGTDCYVPRVHHSHTHPGCGRLLDNILPMISAALKLTQNMFKKQYPAETDPITVLQTLTGGLLFPHRLTVAVDSDGNEIAKLQNKAPMQELACQCMSRMSISLVAGESLKADITNRIRLANRSMTSTADAKMEKCINKNGFSVLHRDERDAGEEGKLKSEESYKRGLPDMTTVGTGDRVMQFVIVICCGLTNADALAAVGLSKEEFSFTLEAPPLEESGDGIRCIVYGMDFTSTWHGNVHETANARIADDAWAVRITTYVTVHAATWANYLKTMPQKEAINNLRLWAGLDPTHL